MIDKSKSILNQKCECGKPIDYFELHEHYCNETTSVKKERNLKSVIIGIWLFILSSIFYIVLILSNDIKKSLTISDDFLVFGFGIGFIIGYFSLLTIYDWIGYKNKRDYNGKKSRNSYINRKKLKTYYRTLNKKQQKIIIIGIVSFTLIAFLPFILFMWFILNPLLNYIESNLSLPEMFITLFLIFSMLCTYSILYSKVKKHIILDKLINIMLRWFKKHNIDIVKLGFKKGDSK